MGISADSLISYALNISSLLTIYRVPEEVNRDLSKINVNLHLLVPKLFTNYEKKQPSHYPVNVHSVLVVDHIEQLDELSQTLNFHGTLILEWEDRRLIWDPRDYGDLSQISFTSFDLDRLWNPNVSFKGATIMRGPVIRFKNSIFFLNKEGKITAEISVSLKASCRTDLSNYPFDNQTCHVMLFSPPYSSSKVTFTSSSSFMAGKTFFGERNVSTSHGFELTDVNSQRFFSYMRGFTTNETEANTGSPQTRTVIRFQLNLQRRIETLYRSTIAFPIFAIAIMSFAAAGVIENTRISLLWLSACFVLQFGNNNRLSSILPATYEIKPFCVKLSQFLLIETLILSIYRIFTEITQEIKFLKGNEDTTEEKIKILRLFKNTIDILLIFETVFIFYSLFC